MATIASALKECLCIFTHLIKSESLLGFEKEVPIHRWEDEVGRLRVWAANIGAHQIGQSSLDYRLRDASHIKTETISLLDSLNEALRDLQDVIEENPSAFEDNEGGEDEGNQPGIELCDSEDTEVQQIYRGLVDIVNYLYRMSMAIRRPASHDQLLKMRMTDAAYFIPWAQQHISNKYPDAEGYLVERIGTATARQRAILKYRERHRAKLGQGIYEDREMEAESNTLSDTLASEYVAPENNLECLDNVSDSGMSNTSYAATLVAGEGSISIPPPPQGSADRNPFECPYCFVIITIKDRKDWARHIFHDLMPYVCIFSNCSSPSRLYESRRQWHHHLETEHGLGPGTQNCPLCKGNIRRPETFERHVGRHFEELALFVLPQPHWDNQDDEDAALSDVSTTTKYHIYHEDEAAVGYETSGVYEVSPLPEPERFANTPPEYLTPAIAIPGLEPWVQNANDRENLHYTCLVCHNGILYSRGSLRHHIGEAHYHEYKLCCPSCNHYVYREDKIREHWEREHQDQGKLSPADIKANSKQMGPPSKCSLCGRSLTSWDDFWQCFLDHCDLNGHGTTAKEKHSSEKSYTNPKDPDGKAPPRAVQESDNQIPALYCGWQGCQSQTAFQREADLMRHVRTVHLYPHDHVCRECERSFNRRDNLIAHMRRRH